MNLLYRKKFLCVAGSAAPPEQNVWQEGGAGAEEGQVGADQEL